MTDEPISNPGITPTPGVPEYGRDKPGLGEGEEAQQRPFSLGVAGEENAPLQVRPEQHPTPMEAAGDAAKQQRQVPPEELSQQINQLQDQFKSIQNQLQDSNITNTFTPDHFDALKKVTEKMNPDMGTIAKSSQGEFHPPQPAAGESMLNYVTQWLNGSQSTLSNALNFLQNTKKPEIGNYLRLQYAVQRATQRGELFASIVGSSVSGIKTIMSTQLG